ncbi:CopD family protein [Arenibaculum pallidiluteum]|uniref:CopD family protein n=1 Tax=Arenibaculum pallidiluteum TaxID=2812559 RepID=UPI001A96B822|nr:CopD family protein [Arenibaculum pallidiluteum]
MDLTLPALPALAATVRVLYVLAMFVAAGGALFLTLKTRDMPDLAQRIRPGLLAVAAAAGSLAVLDLGPHGAILRGRGIDGLFETESWWTGFASDRGLAVSLLLLGLGPLALGVAGLGRGLSAVGTVAGALIAVASMAADSVAAYADPRWISTTAIVLHGYGAALWLGGLWPLTVALTTQSDEAAATLVRRFLKTAMGAWTLLFVSGLALSPVALAEPEALLGTGYGRAWILKLVLALGLLGLAALRTAHLWPLLMAHRPGAAAALRGAVLTQAALGFSLVLVSLALDIAPVLAP